MKPATRYILQAIGFVSLALGFAGLFLPLLPTTPFILLSGWAFAKSSEKWHAWIHRHPEFGPLIYNWKNNRSVSLRHKIVASITVTTSIIFISFSGAPPMIRAGIALGLSTLYVFLLLTPTSPARISTSATPNSDKTPTKDL